MRTVGLWALALSLASVPATGAADAIVVEAALSEPKVPVGEIVTLEITAVASVDGNIEIEVEDVPELAELRRHQSESTSISWTSRGQTLRRQRVVRIDFEARSAGRVTIPPVVARVGDEEASSSALSLDVVGSAAIAPTPAEPLTVEPPGPGEQDVFVRYRVDRAEAYVGEQILVDLDIFTNGSFNLDSSKPPPAVDGFWREVVEQNERLTPRLERVAGRPVRSYRLWRAAYFPLEAKDRVLPTLPLEFSVGRSMFSAGQQLRRRVPPIALKVLPLPSEGRPRDFVTTNVGEYTLTTRVDRTQIPAGKAVTLTITVAGRGNVGNVKLPDVPAIEGFRVFPPTTRQDVRPTASGLEGTKEADLLLLPTRAGRLEIPAIELAVFSPSRREYQRLTAPAISLVSEGAAAADLPALDVVAEDERPADAGPRLEPLRFRSTLDDRSAERASLRRGLALATVPGVLYLLALLGEVGFARVRRETPASRRRRALRAARERLEAARAGRPGELWAAVADTILDLLSERSGLALRGRTFSEGRALLAEAGADAALLDEVEALLGEADRARFGAVSSARPEEVLARADRAITAIDEWRPRR